MKRIPIPLLLAAALALPPVAYGQDKAQDPAQARQQARDRQQIYGYNLMSPEERSEHRRALRSAKSAEERDRVRAENHARMQARAKERGVTLPEAPPARPRNGRGPGKGPAGGT